MSASRREFLKTIVGASSVVSFSPGLPLALHRCVSAAEAAPRSDRTALVVVQLSGGNDGLNTVVPFVDDTYGRNRKTLRLTASEVHRINDELGFHPEMPGLHRLFHEGRLTIVQGVGYPRSNRNHDTALRDWHTGRPGEASAQTGWLGRAIDGVGGEGEPHVPGVFVGAIAIPFAMNAQAAVVPAVRSARELTLQSASGGPSSGRHVVDVAGGLPASPASPLLDVLRRNAQAARATSDKVEAVLRDARETVKYPDFTLARELKTIAELVRADVGIRIFFTELGGGGIGGFDNHADQRDNHAALLRELSASITAFAEDLHSARLLDRVVLMTFSEFGRSLSENGRRGTGHGAAAPIFLAGGRLKGGLVGKHPPLTDLEEDAPRFHTDYRRVYATVLERWLGFDARTALGDRYEPLDVFA